MPVRFVIGGAGSGKTLHCFNAIVQAMRDEPMGPPIYWVLPRQATFTAERQLTCGSGLPAFCRARAVSFEQLGQDIFEECGGSAVPRVTALGRQMILARLLRQHDQKLRFYSSVARQIGLAAELDRTFGELERAGKTPADLALIIDDLGSGPLDAEGTALRDKLRDMHLLYSAYEKFLGQDRLDQHRRMLQVLANVERCSLFAHAQVYVDGFIEFTDFERRLLASIALAGAKMDVTLLMDPQSSLLRDPHALPDEMGLFHRTESTYRKLYFAFAEKNAEIGEPLRLTTRPRFTAPSLKHLERGFVRDHSSSGDRSSRNASGTESSGSQSAVQRIVAASRAGEVDEVSREIRSLLRQGYRLRQIAVLVRNLDSYHTLISASFGEHDIPFFVDRRRAATHHPLIEFLRAAFRIAIYFWPHDSVMALIKSGLAGLTLDQADELENYALEHRVHGMRWEETEPWKTQRRWTRGQQEPEESAAVPAADAIETLRQSLLEKLGPFIAIVRTGAISTVREIAAATFAMFERFEIRKTLAKWMNEAANSLPSGTASAVEERDEHEQVWLNVSELFDEMVDLLGDQQLPADEFVEILEAGLEQFDLALTPPTVDQVLVGQVDRTICPPVRAVFILGLNEGEFPGSGQHSTMFSDGERRELYRRKLELENDRRRRLLDESLLGYVALTRSSERLIIARSQSDGAGRPTRPSIFWNRVEKLLPDAPLTVADSACESNVDRLSTTRQLISGLMRWARRAQENDGSEWPALYQRFAESRNDNKQIERLRGLVWPALTYSNVAKLNDDTARSLFRNPLKATIRQLETFAACPFQHFARHGLELRARPDQDVTPADLGQLYHRVLETLVRQAMTEASQEDPLPISPGMIREAATDVGKALRSEVMLSNARSQYLLERAQRTIAQVVEAQREAMTRNRFRPIRVGTEFGDDSPIPALRIQSAQGNETRLCGKIDRIDALPNGNDTIALDYRL
ncbi:MAG TPA: PD-(D/E)XK nuclease family protein, partial [Tepidisphaeraceae bacterium]|nr:PD-(D/E)XK nuclease family protein [Tepidisphaeraceae bacterium]